MSLEGERLGQDIEEKRNRLRAMIPADLPKAPTGGVDHVAVYAKDLERQPGFTRKSWACR